MNVERALQEAIKKPERGFPKFKNSSEPNQSFTFLPQKGSEGLAKPIKVFGLEQIPEKAEIANAKLVKRFNDFYIYITTYSKDERIRRYEALGLDFGISENLIMSNGIELKYKTPISSKTIKLQQKLSNKIGSKKRREKI